MKSKAPCKWTPQNQYHLQDLTILLQSFLSSLTRLFPVSHACGSCGSSFCSIFLSRFVMEPSQSFNNGQFASRLSMSTTRNDTKKGHYQQESNSNRRKKHEESAAIFICCIDNVKKGPSLKRTPLQ